MYRFLKTISPLVPSILLLSLFTSTAAHAENALIVNANNRYEVNEAEEREVVKRLFLKKQSSWPNGVSAKCFDRSKGGDEQSTFNSNVLGMSDAEIARHWLRLKQTTGETPPRSVGSTSMLMKFVAKYEGGMGVVAESDVATLPNNVRVLFTF